MMRRATQPGEGQLPLVLVFDGPDYSAELDCAALTEQHQAVREYMLAQFPAYRTLAEIAQSLEVLHGVQGLKFPEASVSAQLRHLRKPRFGGFLVEKQRREGTRTWEYRVCAPLSTM